MDNTVTMGGMVDIYNTVRDKRGWGEGYWATA